jgi:hypothetical protein
LTIGRRMFIFLLSNFRIKLMGAPNVIRSECAGMLVSPKAKDKQEPSLVVSLFAIWAHAVIVDELAEGMMRIFQNAPFHFNQAGLLEPGFYRCAKALLGTLSNGCGPRFTIGFAQENLVASGIDLQPRREADTERCKIDIKERTADLQAPCHRGAVGFCENVTRQIGLDIRAKDASRPRACLVGA